MPRSNEQRPMSEEEKKWCEKIKMKLKSKPVVNLSEKIGAWLLLRRQINEILHNRFDCKNLCRKTVIKIGLDWLLSQQQTNEIFLSDLISSVS